MNQNISCNPKIYLGELEIVNFDSFSINEPGSNQINSADIVLRDINFSKSKLFNKEVKIYLNNGVLDSTPIFRGFVKQVTPSALTLKIRATDPRGLISGKDGLVFDSTDGDNYDGYTLSQFLHSYITDNVNINNTYIGLDALNEVEPPVLMKGIRGKSLSAYDEVREKLERLIDDTDIENLSAYALGVLDDGNVSSIIVYKKQPLTNPPSLYLDYYEGIDKLTYKERAPQTSVTASSKDFKGKFTRGNFATGPINKAIRGDYKSNAHAQRMSFLESEKDSEDLYELSINATKGYHTGIDSIVRIKTDDTNISGNFRLVGKKMSYKGGKMSLSLKFNKEPIRVRDYLG